MCVCVVVVLVFLQAHHDHNKIAPYGMIKVFELYHPDIRVSVDWA